MADHSFFGKRRLCYTEVADFTDFQGIGRDPMYKRYDSVFSVVKRSVPANMLHFLATPEYVDDEDRISWHVDNWNERPVRLTDLTGADYDIYKGILDDTVRKYKSSALNLSGEDLRIMAGAIKYIDENQVYCSDGKVYLVAWGMTPDLRQHKVIGQVIHEFEFTKRYKITFDAGEYGSISTLDKSFSRVEGAELTREDLPEVAVVDGWKFIGWDPSPVGHVVTSDKTFIAKYEKSEPVPPVPPEPPIPVEPPLPDFFDCEFHAGQYGRLEGASTVRKEANARLMRNEIPYVIPNKGYTFKGWDVNPVNMLVDGDKVFTAVYEENIPWYRRAWMWLTGLFIGRGCLKYLLWLLLLLLLCWLFSFLFRDCKGCSRDHVAVNGVVPLDNITRPDGSVVDDNGFIRPVTGIDGRLPDEGVIVAPIMGDGGVEVPIIEQPGAPDIIGNRLFLFMEDENGDIEALARDFKQAYPGDQYNIIGYDKEVKLLVIQIPEAERDQIRKTINDKIPDHRFIVFDEELYELNGFTSTSEDDPGWHLKAIHLKEGWNYTKGSPNVKVAVVDDGIQADHPMFKGRIVDAYNVFTQSNSLSAGNGHGTHTAGLAVGSDEFYSKGASGIAPDCKLMPVQVFDNGRCPLSALIAGIMYAVHHDADVVNISIAPSFKGLNVLPVPQQGEIAKNQFRNVALLWDRVCRLAAKRNSILVFAAGNDDILTSIPPENRNASSLVVTAVDQRFYPTEFTNYGPCSDISAPGQGIYSSFPPSTFRSCDGTSMAAPIVAGTVALMKSLKKDLTVEQARNALYSTGADVYGWIPPMVLVDKALVATRNGNFERIEREFRPVPDNVDVHLNSGKIPEAGSPIVGIADTIISVPGAGTVPGNETIPGSGTAPGTETIPGTGTAPDVNKDETDYDAIRRQIAEYKRKIEELEQLLPKK